MRSSGICPAQSSGHNRHQAGAKSDDNLNAAVDAFDLAFRMQMNAPDILDLASETEATKAMYGIGEKATDDNAPSLRSSVKSSPETEFHTLTCLS